MGECLVWTNKFFCYWKGVYKVIDYIMLSYKNKESNQDQSISSTSDANMKNHFYSLCSRGEQEDSQNFVASILQLFFINVYDLVDTCNNLSFVTPLVAKNSIPDILIDTFWVTTM